MLRKKVSNLLEAPPAQSRRTTESGRTTRASFVEYVSEVWPHSSKNTAPLTASSSSTLGGVARWADLADKVVTLHRELSVSSDKQSTATRQPRPFSGSRYKYLGELAGL